MEAGRELASQVSLRCADMRLDMSESVNSDRHDPPGVTSRLAGSRASRMGLALVLGVALVGSLAYLLVLALGGAQLVKIASPSAGTMVAMHDATPWLIVVIAAVATLLGWVLTARQRGGACVGSGGGARGESQCAKTPGPAA